MTAITAEQVGSDPITSYEGVISRRPFVVKKRVRWSDCDPAGVVFTGKFSEYLLIAVGYFFDELGEGNYYQWSKKLGIDIPCKGLELEFHGSLWPGDEFEMHCAVSAVRERSFDISVQAVQKENRKIFTGRFSPICISGEVRKGVVIPDALRRALKPFEVHVSPQIGSRDT